MIRQRIIGWLLLAGFVFTSFQFITVLSEDLLEAAPSLSRSDEAGYVLESAATDETYRLPDYVSYRPIGESNHAYHWQTVETAEQSYRSVLAEELAKYPSSFIETINLNSIFVVDELISYDGVAALGFTDTLSGDIYLRQTGDNRADSELVRSTIHHEIGHLAVIATRGQASIYDSQWRGIDENFIYGSQQAESAYFPARGFVSDYAMTSVAEDMAEVFAFGMSTTLADELQQRAATDEILAQKVEIIASELSRTSLRWPAAW